MRRLLSIVSWGLLLFARVRAQEPDLAPLVWAYLDAKASDATALEKELRERKDLTSERLQEILAAPRPGELPKAGTFQDLPLELPDIKKSTTYSLYVPSGLEPGKRYPLWISSHGTGGEANGALRPIQHALKDATVFVAAPTEVSDLHGKGWGFLHRERQLHMVLLDRLLRELPIDPSRVVIGGWSRGGHAAWDLAMRYPDRFSASAPIIGSVLMRDVPLLDNLHGTRVHAINGALDQAGLVDGVRTAMARLKTLGYPATHLLDEARSHDFFGEQLQELVTMMLSPTRDVAPRRIVYATWDLAYQRNRYVKIVRLGRGAYKPGQSIPIKGVSDMSEAERRAAYANYINEHTPRVEIEVLGQRFDIRAKRVSALELFVPRALVDLDKPLEIAVNGKVQKKKLKPPTAFEELRLLREWGGDPGFRFVAKMPLTVR